MSKPSAKKAIKLNGRHEFAGFANFYLTKTDKEKISGSPVPIDRALLFISEMCEEGYAFKFSYDEKSECVMVLMIGERTKEFNCGKIMSGRHVDILKALQVVMYQHNQMASGESWERETTEVFANDW